MQSTDTRRSPGAVRPWRAALCLALAALTLGWSTAPASAGVQGAGSWTWPVAGEVVTTYRNGDDPYATGQHRGVDIVAEVGEPVRAATDGTVTFAGTAGSSGLTVSVRTADGRYDTSYLHLDSIAVSEGDEIAAGDELGAVGVSGQGSIEEPHLHFGVRDAGERHAYHDPMLFLSPAATPQPPPPPTPIPAPPRQSPALEPVPAAPPQALMAEPAPAGAPRPAPSPKGVPVLDPAGAPAPSPRGEAGRAPEPAGLGEPGAAPAPAPLPGPGGAPQPERGPVARGASPEVVRPSAVPAPDGESSLGWALAGIGAAIAAAAALAERRNRRGRASSSARRHRAGGAPGPAHLTLRSPSSLVALSDRA